ncbi:MAG: methyltransferase domain-containing protein [Candidatus Sulfotelmatobacter sp.]|jgi:SAM-dependent methyltransferase
MQRVSTQEILDSDACPPLEVEASLRDMCRINRWFGGIATTRNLIERVSGATGREHFSVLEVAAGFGEVSKLAGRQLASKGITLDVTDLDRARTHLLRGNRAVVADALALPFQVNSFDLVSCSLFAHHLEPDELARFTHEALRVSRCAVLINDLVRHPVHVTMVYAGFPLMHSYVSRVDGLASVRRAYTTDEMRQILSSGTEHAPRIEISRHFLFRMGVIAWKNPEGTQAQAA